MQTRQTTNVASLLKLIEENVRENQSQIAALEGKMRTTSQSNQGLKASIKQMEGSVDKLEETLRDLEQQEQEIETAFTT